MIVRPLWIIGMPIFLAGCASYAPMPLTTAPPVLTAPDPALLSKAAQTIDRPWLTPQPIDLAAPLTPNALAIIAILENPDLKAQRTKAGVAEAQSFAAGLLPDPTLSLGIDKLLSGPDKLDALAGALGFDLGALRTRRVTRENAVAAAQQIRLDIAWSEWQVSGQTRLQAVRIAALEQQISIARASLTATQSLFERNRRAAGRGDIRAADVEAQRLALLDASTRVRLIETALTTARGELNRLLGLPPAIVIKVAAAPGFAPPPDAASLFDQARRRRLDLQALEAGYAASEAALHKAVLDQFPNLALTITGTRDTGGNRTVGPSVNFSLPLWNRNRGGIAIAKATREQLKSEYEARLFQTRAEIAAAVNGLALSRKQQDEITVQLPELQRYAAATQRAAQRGDLARATAESAQQSLRDRMLTLYQLEQQTAEQGIALELLVGELHEGWTR